ncbi:MAG TPA: hypothetical protein VN316_02685, partial [candidate division Zixibacteria bacterium]|nr:hypothetical protein [candidate division Zixibacteria bacterium]
MKIPRGNKVSAGRIKLSISVAILVTGIVVTFLFLHPLPALTEEKRTSGNLIFTDSGGNSLRGTLELSISGISGGRKPDVNSISWVNVPNAGIYFDVFETKNISLDLKIAGDTPAGRVSLEDYGAAVPEGIDRPAPGILVKYVELRSTNVSFADADISIYYTDMELKGLDENSLVIYGHDRGAWTELPTRADTAKNVLNTTVDTLSIFAISARANEEEIKKFRDLFNPPEVKEHLEADALKTKGVAVKLILNKRGNSQIKLEDYGKKNPVAVAPPGKSIKFVDISAEDISFDSAEVRIHYTDEELGGGDEGALVIYHWNGAAWDALATLVDAANNMLTVTTTSLSPFAVSWGEGGQATMLVATNRFVILDEPRTPLGLGTGFITPGTNFGTNYWDGRATTINATSLYLRNNGTPISSKRVNFTIFWPNGTQYNLTSANTDSNGLANASWDLNNRPYYGNWTIKAEADGNAGNTTFIYNWWGCAAWGTGCNRGHTNENPGDQGTATRNSPYSRGSWDPLTGERGAKSSNKCTICHTLYDGKLFSSRNLSLISDNTSDVHRNIVGGCRNASCHGNYAVHNTNQLIASCYNTTGGCHTPANRSDISNKSTLNGSNVATALSLYSINKTSFNATFHTPNSTVPCIICHGPMHNITKPNESQRFTKNNDTESSHCAECHTSYQKHNQSNTSSGGVNCTLCHSDDVHYIQVFARNTTGGATYVNATNTSRGNCTLCHQNGVAFFNSLEANPDAGRYLGRDPPQVDAPVRHSNDLSNGSKWNSTKPYWNKSSQVTLCKYCHGETNHKSRALGRPSNWSGNNVVNSTIGNTTWCAGCHWQLYSNGSSRYLDMINNVTDDSRIINSSAGYNLSIPPEITGNITYGAFTSNPAFFNHSDISIKSDNSCYGCHRNGTSAVGITGFMHNLTDVSNRVSGPDCISCHDYNKTDQDALHRINNSDMKAGTHANLNKNATNSTNISADNKKCWGCHTSNGSEPRAYYLNYYNMGDRFADPYKCYDCHNSTGKAYINVSSAPQVDQHFKGASNVTAANASDNSSSCVVCHNLSELKVSYTENDTYNSGLSNASHYTRNRTDLRTWDFGSAANCSYCHQNTSTAFSVAMLDAGYNTSIKNHSTTNLPTCYNSTCHKSGWIHNSTLDRPALNATNASSYCQKCHADKGKHNNTLDCSSCHFNSSSNDTIHPIKYLLQNATYNTGNSTAVTCITCHQTTAVDSKLSRTPPKIPSPMYHSDNASNGTIWNSYWTSNNSLTSCLYCHGDTKHNATALGRPNNWKGNNTINSSLNASTWCSSCHYQGYSNYSNMTSTFASLSVPPEITNGTYASNIYNRSNYYNHSLKNYTDAACRLCHGMNISSAASITSFVHNVTMVNTCTDCHYSFEAMNSTNRPDRYVDSGMYNTSQHGSLSC